MKIILKHILKNIWEKKGRSLLIIISLIIATTVFVLNLTMPNELVIKVQETLRSIYGKTDMGMGTVEPFSINDVNIGNEKITYVGVSELDITIDDKQAIVFYKSNAFVGHSFIQLAHKIHSVPFFLFLELSVISTFIGQLLIHFLQSMHLLLSYFTLNIVK